MGVDGVPRRFLTAVLVAFFVSAGMFTPWAPVYASDPWSVLEAGGDEAMPELTVEKEVLLVVPGPAGLDVLNFVTVKNSSDRPVPWVALGLPENAGAPSVEMAPEEGDDPVTAAAAERRGGTIVDPTPLEPGESRWYRIEYPVTGARPPVTVRRPIYFPTKVMEVLVPGEGALAMGPGLEDQGQQALGGTAVRLYAAEGLEPAAGWRLSIGSSGGAAAAHSELPLVTPRRGFTAFYLPALAVVLALAFTAAKQVAARSGAGSPVGSAGAAGGAAFQGDSLMERRGRVLKALERLERARREGGPGGQGKESPRYQELKAELALLERLIDESSGEV